MRWEASQSGARTGYSPARTAAASVHTAMYSLLETAKLDGVNPKDWLTDLLDRIGKGHPINRIGELLSRG